MWLEAISISAIITVIMTALTLLVDQDAGGNMPQVVMYWLSAPTRLLFVLSGPEHYERAKDAIRFLMSIQWLCLGVVTGLTVAFIRLMVKRRSVIG
jgi:hypothetical protein